MDGIRIFFNLKCYKFEIKQNIFILLDFYIITFFRNFKYINAYIYGFAFCTLCLYHVNNMC